MKFHCCDRFRRNAVAAHPTLNGIDYLEVLDADLPAAHPMRQRTLFMHFLKPVAALDEDNLRLGGGDRIRDVRVEWAAPGVPTPADLSAEEAALLGALTDADQVLVVRTDSGGDRSTYRLQLVRSPLDDRVPIDFDPQLAEVEFSFKVECPSEFDCKPVHACPPQTLAPPQINYLAKDYASFRRLMLDRMAQLLPDWTNRPAADTGVALVELLAYVGDQLSYRQDAAATEAYLGTARKRVSLRRHAALVDYAMHDGCNARAWVYLEVDASAITLKPAETRFLTECPGLDARLKPDSDDLRRAWLQEPQVFEPLHEVVVREQHNKMSLYTWGDRRCCLPRGTTTATLAGHFDALEVGDLLLFEEVCGPASGEPGDADPLHRHVVRLTAVRHSDEDPIAGSTPMVDPLTGDEVTEIAWAAEDALPFPLCVSSVADKDHGGATLAEVSVARGNLVLVDHGRTLTAEGIGRVPKSTLTRVPALAGDRCTPAAPIRVAPRFRPQLAQRPLTQAGKVWRTRVVGGQSKRERVDFDPAAPASAAMRWSMDDVQPSIKLTSMLGPDVADWLPRRSLLGSGADAEEFVVEVDEDGNTSLRFGDDVNGRRPEEQAQFAARYRVGNGAVGNVGAEAIRHVVTAEDAIHDVRNPLAARGGVEPESSESVRRRAPQQFRRQERAVTEEDYAEVSTRHADVDNAAATLRWTGSWHSVFVTVDRVGGDPLDAAFSDSLLQHLDRYRMAGHDLELREPIQVPLELALHVCVKPDHFRSDVRRALGELFSNRILRDGRRGLFHPDNFSFGQTVYLSPLYAAAHAIAGVLSVHVVAFRRQGSTDTLALSEGRIGLGRLEIARLDNDPNYPERGVLRLDLHGGK